MENQFDLMSQIIADNKEESKNFISFICKDLPEKPNLPEIMQDRITTTVPTKIEYFDKQWKENPHVTGINQAYAKLEEKAKVGLIDDSFRTTSNKEFKSGTERSFKKTIDSFSRYYAITQESN
jgi:hypothetical protein